MGRVVLWIWGYEHWKRLSIYACLHFCVYVCVCACVGDVCHICDMWVFTNARSQRGRCSICCESEVVSILEFVWGTSLTIFLPFYVLLLLIDILYNLRRTLYSTKPLHTGYYYEQSANNRVSCSLRRVNALLSRRDAVAMAALYSSCPRSLTPRRLLITPDQREYPALMQRVVSNRSTRLNRFPATRHPWEFILYINGVYF